METYTQDKAMQNGDDGVIDLLQLCKDALKCLKKYWLLLVVIAAVVTAVVFAVFKGGYTPAYTAKVTYAVDRTGDTAIDANIAERLSGSVATIASFEEFKEELLKDTPDAAYTISASNTEGTCMFTVVVSAQSKENANLIMEHFQETYPMWASKTVGALELQVVDESPSGELPANAFSTVSVLAKSLLVGIIVCCVIIFIYVNSLKTVRRDEDMQKITNKSCIATIPDVTTKKRTSSKRNVLLLSNKHVDWSFKQSLLAAYSRIEKQLENEEKQVLLVTSGIPQEGKSLLAVNLTIAFVQHGKKTLIIDGDLRNPTVGSLLGIAEETKGLSDYFCETNDNELVITSKGGVDIICGGTVRGELSGMMKEKKMQKLMQRLRRDYDFIIIDTPPSHLFSDASILSGFADAVLYIVRHDYAELKVIQDGISTYIQNDTLLGYIINRNPDGYSSYGRYGRYGSYGKYRNYSKYQRYIEADETAAKEEAAAEEELNTEDTL